MQTEPRLKREFDSSSNSRDATAPEPVSTRPVPHQIRLECNATGQYYTPDDIDWFRNGQRVTSDKKKGIKLLKQLSISQRTISNILRIERAHMEDSYVYVCRSSNKHIANTKYQV